MFLRFLFTAFLLLSFSLAVVGQAVSPTNVSPATGIQVNGGYVVGPNGNGQVPASTVTFAAPPATAGVSVSPIAGISDHTALPQGVQSTLPPSTLVVSSPENASPLYATQPATGAGGGAEAAPQPSESDLAPTVFAGSNISALAPVMKASWSLGEVAVQNKARNGAQQVRTYTNADVQNLINRRGVGNIMEAANRVPSGVMAPEQNATPGQSTTQSTTQGAAQPASGSTGQGTPTSQAGNSGNQGGTSNEAQQNAGTTPQIRQTQPAETQENGQQLPATSTILPLLGLIGLASSSVGLWFRRSRKFSL